MGVRASAAALCGRGTGDPEGHSRRDATEWILYGRNGGGGEAACRGAVAQEGGSGLCSKERERKERDMNYFPMQLNWPDDDLGLELPTDACGYQRCVAIFAVLPRLPRCIFTAC
jgi:hypothetical protein